MERALATITRHLAAPRDEIWRILADASSYSSWFDDLVEIYNIRGDWPAPRSSFDHRYRWGPFRFPGYTRVIEAQPPGHLTVRMRRGPIAQTTLDLTLQEVGDGTDLQIRHTRDAMGVPFLIPLFDQVLSASLVTSLARLERLTQRQAGRVWSGHEPQ